MFRFTQLSGLGKKLYTEGKYSEAQEKFQEAYDTCIRDGDDLKLYLFNEAACYIKLKNYTKEIGLYGKALSKDANCHNVKLLDHAEKIKYYSELTEIYPEKPENWLELAKLYTADQSESATISIASCLDKIKAVDLNYYQHNSELQEIKAFIGLAGVRDVVLEDHSTATMPGVTMDHNDVMQ